MSQLQSVVISKVDDSTWEAHHTPSGKKAQGTSKEDAENAMKILLGMDESGSFSEPNTSDRFSGTAKEIALFLEGPVSEMLALHSGYARLESYKDGVCEVTLGGGCEGCPASQMTLIHGVKSQLQEKFGEEAVTEVMPYL